MNHDKDWIDFSENDVVISMIFDSVIFTHGLEKAHVASMIVKQKRTIDSSREMYLVDMMAMQTNLSVNLLHQNNKK